MAIASELPIFKATYELLRFIISKEVIDKIPQKHRYDIGSRMKMACEDMLENIYRANLYINKEEPIREIRIKFSIVKINLRLLFDEKYLDEKTYSKSFDLIDQIGKQITGWNNHNAKKFGNSNNSGKSPS